MVYVKCLNGLFGENLQGVRFKDVDFKAQKWRFYGQIWFLTAKIILSVNFPSYFSGPFILQLFLLFICKRFVHMSWLGLQDNILWFGWITKIKLCQVLHSPKMGYQSCWYRGANSHDLWWSIISNKQGMVLRQTLHQKACFSRIAMGPLGHKWKYLLDNGSNTWVIAQEWV